MRAKWMALTGLLLVMVAPGVIQAQYNWNADARLCDDPHVCATVHAEARRDVFTIWLVNELDPIDSFSFETPAPLRHWLTLGRGFGYFSPDLGEDGWAVLEADGNGIGGYTWGTADFLSNVDGIATWARFRVRYQEPVHVDSAGLSIDLWSVYRIDYAEDDPVCGGHWWGDVYNPDCPGLEQAYSGGVATITRVTPEPASLALLGTGLVGLAAVSRRRRRKPKAESRSA